MGDPAIREHGCVGPAALAQIAVFGTHKLNLVTDAKDVVLVMLADQANILANISPSLGMEDHTRQAIHCGRKGLPVISVSRLGTCVVWRGNKKL
jgi:hypothetical protein